MTLLHREQILRIKKTAGFHVLFGEIIPFWGRYHDLIVNMLVSRLRCFWGGRFDVNMGNRARKKYIPGGPDGPVFKVNFANENFETFFLVEERGMVSYVTLKKWLAGKS